jgi:phosphatidylglycerol---prolipoprotein diacylglyceryl transferase
MLSDLALSRLPVLEITDPFPPGFHLAPIQIRFYGIAYAIAFVVGTAVASRRLVRRGLPPSITSNIAFWTIVFGLLGARIYFVVQSGWWWS